MCSSDLTRFVFVSDEFFAITGRQLPEPEEYEGYPQLENGVGLMKSFEDEIDEELSKIKIESKINKKYALVTGTLASDYMNSLKEKILEKFENLQLEVIAIKNRFFGETITVAGLVTGGDLLDQLKDYTDLDLIIIPRSMMKSDEEIFLDDVTLEELSDKLKIPVIPSKVEGKSLIEIIKNQGVK